MACLYLLRHANAGFGGPDTGDHERPLDPAGQRASRALGAYLARPEYRFDIVLCSTAERAQATWREIAAGLEDPPTAEFEQGLYLCPAAALHRRLTQLPKSAETALIVGHNPGLHEAALFYCGGGEDDVVSQLRLDFPPAAMAILRFSQDWGSLSAGSGYLQAFVTPPY